MGQILKLICLMWKPQDEVPMSMYYGSRPTKLYTAAECKKYAISPWSVNARLLPEWHLSHGIYF